MGDGFQRCFQVAAAAAAYQHPILFVDEIENGLHHGVLLAFLGWLATISQNRGLQVFATTHSEECIAAACDVFNARNDDGLRVVRLDRGLERTTAAVYDRKLLETAASAGVEIRG
jgi:AAA15 family ATPase/GTPase